MAISPAPPQPRRRDRAHSSSPRRHLPRWIILVLLLATAGFAFATPALAATQATAASQAATTQATQATHATQTTQGTGTATSPVKLTAEVTPNLPGGVCQVPGIGDIGGLVGLCQSGSSGIVGDLNNICEPSLPQPEQATGGIDAMVEPPATSSGGMTLYDNYGIAGQFWAAHGLQCSDMSSLIGNNVAGMVFDAAKSFDRVTITVYQSAAGNNILTWLQDSVDGLITALGNAIYFPYLAPVVILGAIWLAWQGLIRKRATRTIEGTLWMVVACVAAIALIGRPAAFTGVGTTVSNGVTSVLNEAFSKLPAPAGSNCLPVQQGDPQSVTGNYAFTSGNGLVDNNANELWSVLVCKPWLDGELGTTEYATTASGQQTVVNTYGRQLLWSQAVAANETPSNALIQAKQATYTGIANYIQQNDAGHLPPVPGEPVDQQAGDRLRRRVRRIRGRAAHLADLADPDRAQARLPAAACGRAVLPDRRHPPGLRPGHRHPLVRDAGRRADETGGHRRRAECAAVLLFAHHGHRGRGPAMGAEDPDDRPRHGGRVHLSPAVLAPVLRRRLRCHRIDRTG